jgi:NAD(P)-dependent dehydrogenase (short-subunit alcohol dehydrogenase family)
VRRAIVTGCSSGIGLATAVALARAGLEVTATMRDLARRGRLEEASARAGVTLAIRRLDVTDEPSIAEALAELEATEGGVDVLVNNAGIGFVGALEETSAAELRAVFEANFFGLAAVTRAIVPAMRARGRGRIINVSSLGGRVPLAGLGAYAASKFAVEGYSDALRRELAPFGVAVSVVQPGAIRTDMIGPEHRVAALARASDSPYAATTEAHDALMRALFEDAGARGPELVARAIVRLVESRRPSPRVRVGIDAHVLTLLDALLPARAVDWLAQRAFARANATASGALAAP